MSFSSGSLLQRLQQAGDQTAWERLVDLYSGHLFMWACRAGLPGEQAAELVRGVFAVAAAKLAEFRPGTPGGFRAWLRGLAHAQRRELLSKQVHAGVPAPADVAVPRPRQKLCGRRNICLPCWARPSSCCRRRFRRRSGRRAGAWPLRAGRPPTSAANSA